MFSKIVPVAGGIALAVLAAGGAQAAAGGGVPDAARRAVGEPVIYVANQGAGSVTPINARTWKAGKAIKVGSSPGPIAITPNGAKAYVVNGGE